MLVRLKKRGELPIEHGMTMPNGSFIHKTGPIGMNAFKGCCIEVEAAPNSWPCGGTVYLVTDSRVLALYERVQGWGVGICSHYLIDDLNAYDSDSNDEQAEVGDLVFAELRAEMEVKR